VGNQWAEEHQAANREANMEEAWNNYNQVLHSSETPLTPLCIATL